MRTKAEVCVNLETTTAYVVEIPVKAASRILKYVLQLEFFFIQLIQT